MAKHAIDDLAVIISANTQQLAGDLRAAVRMFDGFRKDVEKQKAIGPAVDTAAIKNLASGIRGITGFAKDAAMSVAGIAAKTAVATTTFGAMQAAAMGFSASFQQAKESVNLAADLEQTTLAFEVMLGSADAAKKMIGDIRQFAATTPFNTKELTEASRMLIAYGTSADQVIPTVRMLGDVSAGMGKDLPIRDLTYLYGTLQAQGRAYTKDINQFTNRGIDVLPQLSKELGVSTAEVMKLVEEGRVGFPEIVKAFKAMTGEGGRFNKMTERQSKTFAGLREAAYDAFDQIKTKFGQIIIDEWGLKDAAKDFDRFAKNVIGNMDKVRPAVKFVGDAVKGLIQGVYELAKAGGQIAGGIFDQAGAAWPGLKDAADSFRRMVADAQNFKFDKREVVKFGVALGETVITAVNWAIEAATTFGKDVWENVAKPIIEAARAIKDAVEAVRNLKVSDAVKTPGIANRLVADQFKPEGKIIGGFMGDPAVGRAINAAGNDAFAVEDSKRWFKLYEEQIGKLKPGKDDAEMLRLFQEQFKILNNFDGDKTKVRESLLGVADHPLKLKKPEFSGFEPPQPAPAKGFQFDAAALKDAGKKILDEFDAADATEKAKKLADETKKAADALAAFGEAMRGPGGAGGFHELAMGIGRIEDAYGGLQSRFFRGAVDALKNMNEVRVPGGPSTQVLEFVNQVKDETDPLRKLRQDRRLLDEAAKFGLLTRDQLDATWTRKVRGLAGQMGVDGETRLSDAVTVGSQEDARLLARHMTPGGGGAVKTEDLLQRLVQLAELFVRQDAEANRSAPVLRLLPNFNGIW